MIAYYSVKGNSPSSYDSDEREAASSNLATIAVRAEPVAIVRSEFTGPNEGNYHYAYGEMKVVGDHQVYMMRES